MYWLLTLLSIGVGEIPHFDDHLHRDAVPGPSPRAKLHIPKTDGCFFPPINCHKCSIQKMRPHIFNFPNSVVFPCL